MHFFRFRLGEVSHLPAAKAGLACNKVKGFFFDKVQKIWHQAGSVMGEIGRDRFESLSVVRKNVWNGNNTSSDNAT